MKRMKRGKDYIGVGVGAIIVDAQGRLFLSKRGTQAGNERGLWEFPGGAVEFGETLHAALQREMREEYGIAISVGDLLDVVDHLLPDEGQHWVSPTFVCTITSGEPHIIEPEKCADIGWFLPEEIPAELSRISQENLRHYLQRAGSKQKSPLKKTQKAEHQQPAESASISFMLPTSWQTHLQEELQQPYIRQLAEFVQQEYATKTVYPPADQIFAAFTATSFEQVQVVILGQDPYHGKNQANGLAFSVNDGIRMPPSLKNIFLELQADLGVPIPQSGNLMRWAAQGVLLLNALLTVAEKTPRSHQNKGWERLTDNVIRVLSAQRPHLVFLLWGAYAQQKGQVIANRDQHLILETAHPSPYSAFNGFFGCRHFSQTNAFLQQHGLTPIEW